MHRRECVRVRVPLLPGGRAVPVPLLAGGWIKIVWLSVLVGPHARLPGWLCCTPYFHRVWAPPATIPRQGSLGRNAQLAWAFGKACEDEARLTSPARPAMTAHCCSTV